MNTADRDRIREEFPDYDGFDTMPDYAALGFVAYPWHNDACPKFEEPRKGDPNDFSGWQLFIDYADPNKRELGPDSGRFTLGWQDKDGGYDQDAYNGDDWAEVVRIVKGERPNV